MNYRVSKNKGSNCYYVRRVSDNTPVSGTYGNKKKALRIAARMNGIDLKTYLKWRKENPDD